MSSWCCAASCTALFKSLDRVWTFHCTGSKLCAAKIGSARDELVARLRATPQAYVAQELVAFSQAPAWSTKHDRRLLPRGVALRVYVAATADGYTAGSWQRYSIDENGVIMGQYSNGKSRAMGQIAMANFASVDGLTPLGNNAWAESSTSGSPMTGEPSSGGLGDLRASAVEVSNVDLTAELVNMITAQRAYQANAQTIKTQDSVLQTLVNLR